MEGAASPTDKDLHQVSLNDSLVHVTHQEGFCAPDLVGTTWLRLNVCCECQPSHGSLL